MLKRMSCPTVNANDSSGDPTAHYRLRKNFRLLIVYMAAVGLVACGASSGVEVESPSVATERFVECVDPRPQACTREYLPVCATHHAEKTCTTEFCSTTTNVTYATGCTACADPKVSDYRLGKCE